MRKLIILICITLVAASCTKNRIVPAIPGTGLPEPTVEEMDEVAKVAGSVGDFETYAAMRTTQTQPSYVQSQRNEKESALYVIDDYILNNFSCQLNLTSKPKDFDTYTLFSVGGAGCDVTLSSEYDLKMTGNPPENPYQDFSMTQTVSAKTQFEVVGGLSEKVSVVQFASEGTGTSRVDVPNENSVTFSAQALFSSEGTIAGAEGQTFSLNRSISTNVAMRVTRRDSTTGYPVEQSYNGSGMEVFDFKFPDFQMVFVRLESFDTSGNLELAYYINGRAVDMDDDEAVSEYQQALGLLEMPGSSTGLSKSLSQSFLNN